jgi:hypothetical protein
MRIRIQLSTTLCVAVSMLVFATTALPGPAFDANENRNKSVTVSSVSSRTSVDGRSVRDGAPPVCVMCFGPAETAKVAGAYAAAWSRAACK